jgi:hypothetical protein
MSQTQAEKDVDELDDFEDEDDDNSTEFRVRDPLNPPMANLFSTQALHSKLHLTLPTAGLWHLKTTLTIYHSSNS